MPLADQLHTALGTRCEVLPADLTADADTERVIARIDADPIDVLVNNAGFGTTGTIARSTRAEQDAMVRLHVLAAHRLAQAALQGMVSRGRGSLINVSSVASWLPSRGTVNYSATKAYLRLYVESLALELRGTGVYAQALCPGFTHTEFHERARVDKARQPHWMWMDADRVVRESLEAMRRAHPTVVIPGRRYQVIVFLLRWLPRWVRDLLTGRFRRDGAIGSRARQR